MLLAGFSSVENIAAVSELLLYTNFYKWEKYSKSSFQYFYSQKAI